MGSSLINALLLIFSVILLLTGSHTHIINAENFVESRATYYSTSDDNGTRSGACGFGSFGATVNGGDVAATSNLYRDGLGCGACYQIKCTNSAYCTDNGVTAVVTDQGSGDATDFILSKHAFTLMAQTTDDAQILLSFGTVNVQYRRVSCNYPGKNITFKIDNSSSYPYYLAFAIYYQQGSQDIIAVQLCETQSFTCKVLDRDHGAVWATTSPPVGPLSLRMLLTDDGDHSQDKWLVPSFDIPQDWKPGDIYDSGVQLN